ncbi:uncharacterized protein BP01DRAFT_369365 [Aspergillus saccharolyticus JOP 1030-1]|uniref:Uncharacterized protein n=1 Tax=Aspergillus saccharolyticus JOP 1030-1 TaxID=1450539 RepID=A0A318Z2A8_9EURO|nr:hypothetical protein BP01DRAFT_369365 [Aspergillus saccharolyticus JOP 1030-1]PYH41079.1 hypothetical protein BP01DRAFT_369365 [Aspergillus saccharolyticus JOP 1030-1]
MDVPRPIAHEGWYTEFEGHTIRVIVERSVLDDRGFQATQVANNNIYDRLTPISCFEIPTNLAAGDSPQEFARRFLQLEWRRQRQNHSLTPDLIFAGAATCMAHPPRMLLFHEACPGHPGKPVIWSAPSGQIEFPLEAGMRVWEDRKWRFQILLRKTYGLRFSIKAWLMIRDTMYAPGYIMLTGLQSQP